jgi:hypothetical protein
MKRRICFFGGTTRGQVTLENGHVDKRVIDRDVWFDRDLNGQWLVWALAHDGNPTYVDDVPDTGAIAVRNPDAIAFIELLAQLIDNPPAFGHEPIFTGATGGDDD